MVSLLCLQPQSGADNALLQAEARPVVERDHGILHRLLGGQLIGIYGLDETAGDEALRAVRAGLMLRSVVGTSASLLVATIHLLFSEGLQLVSDELDDALALLARIPPGEIILDSASRDLTRDRVKLRRRGRREVVDRLSDDRAERPVLGVMTPIVGRASEIAFLTSLFDDVDAVGVSHFALVSGAPGIGKSRLGRTLLGELRPRTSLCLEARAVASKQRTPYSLLGDALARMAQVRFGDEEDARREALEAFVRRHVTPEYQEEVTLFLGEAIGVSFNSGTLRWSEALAQRLSALRVARAEPQVMREKIVSAAERLLLDAAQSAPVTILFEDLQWADDDSLYLLGALMQRLRRASIFFLGTCRPEFFERAVPWVEAIRHRIDLAPIDERSMARLLRAILGRIEREHEQRMLDWCDGNPYFAEELVSWMVARKAMVFGKEGWHLVGGDADLELPAGIEGAIQGRLDHLSAEQRELLKGASVFGEIFWEDALSILDIPNVARELEGLAALDLVARAEDSAFAGTRQWFFRHKLVVQVAYRMVPKARRQELHHRAGEWLESAGEEDAAILAHHYARGGDALRATMYHARVAERALAEGDLDRALASFAASLAPGAATIPRDELLGRLLGLAKTQLRRGDLMAVEATVDRMEGGGAKEDPLLVAELSFLRGRVELIRGAHDRAQVHLLDAIDRFWRLGERHRAFDVKHTLFSAIWIEGRYDDAGPLAEALHREAAPERPEQLCSAKLASALDNIVRGDLSAAIILAEQAVDHARDCGHIYREIDALTTLGVAQELCGLFEAAFVSFSDARRIAMRLGTTHHQASIEASLGRLRLSQGAAAMALEHHDRAIEAAEGSGDERSLVIALAGRVRASIRLTPQRDGAGTQIEGDGEVMSSSLLRVRADAERANTLALRRSSPEEIEAKLALLEVLLALGERVSAARVANDAIAVLDSLGTHERYEVELLLAASRSHEALGDHATAMSYLQRAWQALRRRGARITVPSVRESFYRAVPHHRAVQHLWRARTALS